MSRKDMSESYEEKKEVASTDASKDVGENVDELGDPNLIEEQGVPVEDTDTGTGSLVFINGKRIQSSALKSLQIQYSRKLLVVEIDYDEEEQKRWKELPLEKEEIGTSTMTDKTKITSVTSEDKPSASGVSIPKSDGPEVYDLEEKDFVKLCAMSSLRANNKRDDSISKLKVKASGKYKIEEVELNTVEHDIKDITGMSSALNDLAVQEQKIQKDPNIVKVREVIGPKTVFKGTLFTLTEKFKLYKEKESVDEE